MKTAEDIVHYFDSIHMKEATAALLDGSRRSPDATPFPPAELAERYHLSHRLFDHRPAFRLTPEAPAVRLLYLHGGAYYNDFAPAHWKYMDRLAQGLNAEVVTPDYPLTPVFGYRDVFSMITQVYRDCLNDLPEGGLLLAGDSAGGGLALALTQWAIKERLPRPRRLALLSPWLDITMSDPAISELDKVDPFLEPVSGRRIARWYARGDDPRFYQISPLFGPMEGLPPVLTLTGTRDILNADARRFHAAALSAGTDSRLLEAEGIFHTWMIFGIQEAVEPTRAIIRFFQA